MKHPSWSRNPILFIPSEDTNIVAFSGFCTAKAVDKSLDTPLKSQWHRIEEN